MSAATDRERVRIYAAAWTLNDARHPHTSTTQTERDTPMSDNATPRTSNDARLRVTVQTDNDGTARVGFDYGQQGHTEPMPTMTPHELRSLADYLDRPMSDIA